jgi:hypothetical protein
MKSLFHGLLAILVMVWVAAAEAGMVIVNNDEWTLSDAGFSNAPDAGKFATNIAALFSGGGTGSFHAYTTNFGFTGSSLSATLNSAGHAYTTGTGFAFTQENISGFDGLFLGGAYLSSVEINTLINYVKSGGNVYLAGGTGVGGADTEAAAWNPLLNAFGMAYAGSYNGILGNINVTGATHPLFNGVTTLYQNSGNSIAGAGIQVSLGGEGLYAVVPLPASIVLLASGLAALGGLLVRRRRGAV